MFKSARQLCVPMLIILLTPLLGAADTDELRVLSKMNKPITEVSTLGLSSLLGYLAAHGITPRENTLIDLGLSRSISVIPLRDSDNPRSLLYLYYIPDEDAHFFLRATRNSAGEAQVVVWGAGDSELLISQKTIAVVPKTSNDRLTDDRPIGHLRPRDLGLSCIAQTLGITADLSSLLSQISSAACTASNTLALAFLAGDCLSFPDPAGVAACVVGIAQLVTCGILNCTQANPPQPTNTAGTQVQWITAPPSAFANGATFTVQWQTVGLDQIAYSHIHIATDPNRVISSPDYTGFNAIGGETIQTINPFNSLSLSIIPGTSLYFTVHSVTDSSGQEAPPNYYSPIFNAKVVSSGTGNLQLTFSQNPVPQGSPLNCSGGGYSFDVTVSEIGGADVNLTELDVDTHQNVSLSGLGFPNTISALTESTQNIYYCRSAGVSNWTLIGSDSTRSFTTTAAVKLD